MQYKKKALKDLKQIPLGIRTQFIKKLSAIAEDPSSIATKALGFDIVDMGKGLFRLRHGEYRAVYLKKDEELIILVVKVKPRGEVYK